MNRHHLNFLSLTFCLFLATSCNSQDKSTNQAKKAATANNTNKVTKFAEGTDYFVFNRVRIMDRQAFTQPVEAYSILLPKTWTTEGEVFWTGPGQSCAGTNMGFKARSVDGKYSLELLPIFSWSWNTNPQTMQFNQSLGSTPYCSFGQPLDAEQYLRNVMVQEFQNPTIIEIKPNASVVEEMDKLNDKGRRELMRYGASQVNFRNTANMAKVKWNDGTEGLLMCGVGNIESYIPNVYNGTFDISYTSTAAQRVVFKYPAGKIEEAEKMFSVIMGSFRTNPVWRDAVNSYWASVREQRNRDHIGKIQIMDAQTAAIGKAAIEKGNQRLGEMDTQLRNWEAQQSSQDRMHTSFIKTIREVENYRDETGKIELSAGYNHAWSRSDGSSYIMSNSPNFDPSSVLQDNRWKEMKKVD
ncbi:MAG: hypothetical protein ACXWV2_11000 [Chitinophagaceae bacterium]